MINNPIPIIIFMIIFVLFTIATMFLFGVSIFTILFLLFALGLLAVVIIATFKGSKR